MGWQCPRKQLWGSGCVDLAAGGRALCKRIVGDANHSFAREREGIRCGRVHGFERFSAAPRASA